MRNDLPIIGLVVCMGQQAKLCRSAHYLQTRSGPPQFSSPPHPLVSQLTVYTKQTRMTTGQHKHTIFGCWILFKCYS